MYEKVVVITPGRADEMFRRTEDDALFAEAPEPVVEEMVERTAGSGPAFLRPITERIEGAGDTVRSGTIHERLGIQWWMWAVLATLLFALLAAWLLARLFSAGYPGLDLVGSRAVSTASGTEQIRGTLRNRSLNDYKDIVLKVKVMDANGQEIDSFEEFVGDMPSGVERIITMTPKGNLGPAYRFQVDIGRRGGPGAIPWWVWVAVGSMVLLAAASIFWASVTGYKYPGLEIVAAHLEARGDGSVVAARLVNYSKRDYERIVVQGAIYDTYDRVVENLSHFVGVVGAKSQREFTFSPNNPLEGDYKVILRIGSI